MDTSQFYGRRAYTFGYIDIGGNSISITSLLKYNKTMKELYGTIPKLKPLVRYMNNSSRELVNFPIKAPLLSKNPSLIGHAYDDFFQLYCQRLNYSLHRVEEPFSFDDTLDVPHNIQMDTILNQGLYVRGLKTWDYDMTEQSIIYGKIDQAYRSGIEIDDLLSIHKDDFEDMESLIKITYGTTHSFLAKTTFIPRPTFGHEISYLVGGADGDLIIDETLIDIKVNSRISFESYPWHQLFTYYILGQLTPEFNTPISRLAIWNPRYDVMMYMELEDIMTILNIDNFLENFIRTLERIHVDQGSIPFSSKYIDSIKTILEMRR